MQQSKFFRVIWQYNGLVLAVASTLAIAVLSFISYKVFKEIVVERSITNVVKTDSEKVTGEGFMIGYIEDINDGDHLIAPLISQQSYTKSYYNKSSSSQRNMLFINAGKNSSSWLFNDNESLITDYRLLSNKEADNSKSIVKAIFFTIAKADTNDDGFITDEDIKTIALSDPDGSKYKEIETNINKLHGHKFLNNNQLVVIYEQQGVDYHATIDTQTSQIVTKSKIAQIGL
ncbi:hypothetical protein GZ77_05595 [Endozoicomonas montiporae]|uniref:EF-hand domain-containing protein n=2 Tax=Endozoicomonas montiporae TaxID=1027273 RepID=A0A081NBY5_9GAMM|nr:hypothetical protein [Endozoicomonas montiporae]AMO56277.1 hypothetical protein EZMO1_2167 [Endozoicomonas montiporae CL-33]KEQ15958.1 hypothetical protein GZ77_05595 [Endozoicomonas montiporae]